MNDQQSRNMTVSVRLTPKGRYAAELLANSRMTSMSETINACIEDCARRYLDKEDPQLLDRIWHDHPVDRLMRLAQHRPAWLTLAEDRMVRAVVADPNCWKGKARLPDPKAEPNLGYIRTNWQNYRSFGEPDRSTLSPLLFASSATVVQPSEARVVPQDDNGMLPKKRRGRPLKSIKSF